ncbi:hypothetical protein QBC42DRAFT_348821 [Cladorrhinum samala]|uniref:Cell wall galactomannoprotein n=1 Tax=Cladorrhinum samala TaxID=585594 RepID=A0AAV9HGV1_9PEZI|nr:hypothetical protein QBC42DRAFT_348821 [Cladorrhinum samala]
MKSNFLTTTLPLLFLLSPLSSLASASSASTISTALNKVQQSTSKLGDSITSWNGKPLSLLLPGPQNNKNPILVAAVSLLAQVEKATKTARDSGPVPDLEGALQVAQATTDLVGAVNVTLEAIIRAKPKFDRTLLTPLILIDLGLQRKATAGLSQEVVNKIPPELQDTARELVKPVDEGFALAIRVFHQPPSF